MLEGTKSRWWHGPPARVRKLPSQLLLWGWRQRLPGRTLLNQSMNLHLSTKFRLATLQTPAQQARAVAFMSAALARSSYRRVAELQSPAPATMTTRTEVDSCRVHDER
jgi:hypothetical protein